MTQGNTNNNDADAINEMMVRQMEQRRQQRPERRQRGSGTAAPDRRAICSYCFQRGDHQTPAQCLTALERAN